VLVDVERGGGTREDKRLRKADQRSEAGHEHGTAAAEARWAKEKGDPPGKPSRRYGFADKKTRKAGQEHRARGRGVHRGCKG